VDGDSGVKSDVEEGEGITSVTVLKKSLKPALVSRIPKRGSIFVLSGEEVTFPASEIRALVETYAPSEKCETWGRRVVYSALSNESLISKINERAAYCRFGGTLVSASIGKEKLDIDPVRLKSMFKNQGNELSFAVDSETLSRETCGDVGAKIKEITAAKVSLNQPELLFHIEETDFGLVLAAAKSGYKKFSWRERRPRARAFFLPSAIYPKLSRLLVNLSHIREGDLLLDPFCGTGSLLIEASLMGMRTAGIDLARWVARGASKNLKGFGLADQAMILSADSTREFLPFSYVDAVATDVPYGRAASTRGKDTRTILREFVSSPLAEVLKNQSGKQRYAVVMRPSYVELELDRKSFQLQEEHLLYVHRNLTRAIDVLRRV